MLLFKRQILHSYRVQNGRQRHVRVGENRFPHGRDTPAPSTSTMPLTASERVMFCQTIRRVTRPMAMATLAGSSF